jgi:hypothetical protein
MPHFSPADCPSFTYFGAAHDASPAMCCPPVDTRLTTVSPILDPFLTYFCLFHCTIFTHVGFPFDGRSRAGTRHIVNGKRNVAKNTAHGQCD